MKLNLKFEFEIVLSHGQKLKTKTSISSDRKELFRWNKNHLSAFLKSFQYQELSQTWKRLFNSICGLDFICGFPNIEFKRNSATNKVFPNSPFNILEGLQKIGHLCHLIPLHFWHSIDELCHSHTIIKRKFKIDSRVRTSNKSWLISVSITTKLCYYCYITLLKL